MPSTAPLSPSEAHEVARACSEGIIKPEESAIIVSAIEPTSSGDPSSTIRNMPKPRKNAPTITNRCSPKRSTAGRRSANCVMNCPKPIPISIKPTPTAEEKAELDRIKADVMAADKKNKELSVKTNLTPEDRALIEEYSKRANNMEMTAGRWLREFTNELQTWADKQKLASLDRARVAVQEVAKAQGFTIVFEVGVAPYGANDLTDASLKAMNAKK